MAFPQAKRHDFDALREGQSARIEFIVSEAEMAAFAALSGDYNPLHCNDGFAQDRGFGSRVVYGALLVAKLSRLIGMELPGQDALWQGVALRFHKPLLIGRPAELAASIAHVSSATRSFELALRITSEGALIARGTASVGMLDVG